MVVDEGTEGPEAALTLTEVQGVDAIDLSLLSRSHMTGAWSVAQGVVLLVSFWLVWGHKDANSFVIVLSGK